MSQNDTPTSSSSTNIQAGRDFIGGDQNIDNQYNAGRDMHLTQIARGVA